MHSRNPIYQEFVKQITAVDTKKQITKICIPEDAGDSQDANISVVMADFEITDELFAVVTKWNGTHSEIQASFDFADGEEATDTIAIWSREVQ